MRSLRSMRVLWIFPLLTGLLLGQMVLDPAATWPGWWQRTTVQIHTVTLMILGTAALAASAWVVAVARGRGLLGSQAAVPTSGARVVARLVGPVWVGAVAGFAVLLTVASIRSASVSPGAPTWSLVALTVAFLGLQVSFGALAGVWLPKFIAPAVALVALMGLTGAQLYVEDGERTWGRLLPVLQQPFWDPTSRAADGRILAATAWLFVASGLLLAAAGLRRPLTPIRWTRLIGLAAAGGVLAMLVLVPRVPEGQAAFADQIGPRDEITCEAVDRGRVCVRSREQDLLPTFRAAYARLHDVAGGLDTMPHSLVETGIANDGGFEVQLVSRNPTQDSVLIDLIGQLPTSSPPGCPRAEEPALGLMLWPEVVTSLLERRAGLGLDAEPSPVVTRLERLSRGDQDAWLNQASQAVATCRPVPAIH
ncbi:hypothetical protein GCM10027053_23070 [Intrasporangium mesophilum]